MLADLRHADVLPGKHVTEIESLRALKQMRPHCVTVMVSSWKGYVTRRGRGRGDVVARRPPAPSSRGPDGGAHG